MTHVSIFLCILAMCVTFLICAFRAEDRAYEAEQKYKQLRMSFIQLELGLNLKADMYDPEFAAGWNMAMLHTKSMIRGIRKHA